MFSDIRALFAALAANGAGRNAVIIAGVPQATTLQLAAGAQFNTPVLASTALVTGSVAALELSSFVSGFGNTVEFSASKAGTLHMEDTASADISGAVPVRSMFQIDLTALRSSLWASWAMRAPGHIQFLTGATW